MPGEDLPWNKLACTRDYRHLDYHPHVTKKVVYIDTITFQRKYKIASKYIIYFIYSKTLDCE